MSYNMRIMAGPHKGKSFVIEDVFCKHGSIIAFPETPSVSCILPVPSTMLAAEHVKLHHYRVHQLVSGAWQWLYLLPAGDGPEELFTELFGEPRWRDPGRTL